MKTLLLLLFSVLTHSLTFAQDKSVHVTDGQITKKQLSFVKSNVAGNNDKNIKTYKLDGKEYEMVYVDGGGFEPFYIMQTELPPSAKIELNGKTFGPLNVNGDVAVTRTEYSNFIKSIREYTGLDFMLPTEKEWMYAAKGGRYSKNYLYSGSNNIDDVAWYVNNSSNKVHPVAQKQPNELGLYDMSGNYGEVCFDYEVTNGVDGDIYGGYFGSTSNLCTNVSYKVANKSTGKIDASSVLIQRNTFDARVETIRLIYYPFIAVESIKVNASSNRIIKDEKLMLTATVAPENATDKSIIWSSSAPLIVSVDETTGEITGVNAGTAIITAIAADGSGVTGSIEITVKEEGGNNPGGNDEPSTDVTVTPRPTSGNYMYVEHQKVKPGNTMQIPVELVLDKMYEDEIVGFQCNIKLPEGFEFQKNSKGNAVITLNTDRTDGHSVTSKVKEDGSLNIVCTSMDLSTIYDLDGDIMYINAIAGESIAYGEYAMQISKIFLSTEDEQLACPDITQALEVKNFTLGDLNDDEDWTILDVTLTIKHVLDETFTDAGDMNEDGEITILDVTKVIQYVLNEGPLESAAPAVKNVMKQPKAKGAAKKTQKIYAENMFLGKGATETLYVSAHLDSEDYVGCQLEMTLPEGFSFVTNKSGKVVVTPNPDRCESHTATTKLLEDGRTLRIVLASLNLDPIYQGEDDILFTVKIKSDADVEAGNHAINITKVLFSTEDNQDSVAGVDGYFRIFGNESISLTVPEGGYATLCLPYDAEIPSGLKAYKATGVKNGMVVIEEQTSIKACVPMIIEGTAGTYNFLGDNYDADEYEYSAGSLTASFFPAEINNGYVLQNLSDGLGFYKIKDALTVPAFRCVLDGAAVSAAPAFVPVGFEDDATSIDFAAVAIKSGDAIYTLDGKCVKTMEKGKIYIVDGVKMIVK